MTNTVIIKQRKDGKWDWLAVVTSIGATDEIVASSTMQGFNSKGDAKRAFDSVSVNFFKYRWPEDFLRVYMTHEDYVAYRRTQTNATRRAMRK